MHIPRYFRFVMFALVIVFISSGVEAATKAKLDSIRVGWQVGWATQGQLAQVLKHTNILDRNNLEASFSGFTYGAPLNEAALAGSVDVIFTADLPAMALISKDPSWKIVARLITFRATIIVPKDSGIKTVSDLKGKTLSIPFGASTHRIALKMLKDAGLETSKDVKIRNLDIQEQNAVIRAGSSKEWGEIDAFASWDPNIAIFESEGKARVLEERTGVSVVVMSDKYIKAHPRAAENFLKSYIEGYYYYSQHQKQADEWFKEEARIKFDPNLLTISASYEPNLKATSISKIDVSLSPQDIDAIKDGVEFSFEQKLIKKKPDVNKSIDMSIEKKAVQSLKKSRYDEKAVKVVK